MNTLLEQFYTFTREDWNEFDRIKSIAFQPTEEELEAQRIEQEQAIPLAGSIKGGKGGIGTPVCYANFIVFSNSTTSFGELQWSDITNGDRLIVSGDYLI